jgi:hypothetical protein
LSKRLIAALFGVLAIAVIAAGCGSSDSSDSSSGDESSATALTKPEFIKAADAVCEEGNEAISEEVEEFGEENGFDAEKANEAQQEELISEVVAPAIGEQAAGISELGAPSGEEEAVEEIVEAVEAGAEEGEEDPSSFLVENGNEGPFDEANELADEFGLKVCGGE